MRMGASIVMRKFLRFSRFSALFIPLLLVPTPAVAGSITGQVSKLVARASDGLQLVEIAGTATEKPACARYSYFLIRDEKSDTGKTHYAMLMSAFLSGSKVTIQGSGSCIRWGDGEDIEAVQFSR
jgi:hypothetical protein